MSDCFDHMLDAFESSHENMLSFGSMAHETAYIMHDGAGGVKSYRKHKKITLIHQTEKAYLFGSKKGDFWVPKSLCRDFNQSKGRVYIWHKFEIKYLPKKGEGGMMSERDHKVGKK